MVKKLIFGEMHGVVKFPSFTSLGDFSRYVTTKICLYLLLQVNIGICYIEDGLMKGFIAK